MTIEEFKENIKTYIDSYLDNNDELTENNKDKFKRIQNNDEILTRLAT